MELKKKKSNLCKGKDFVLLHHSYNPGVESTYSPNVLSYEGVVIQ
jgi:hypothetical protein